MESHGICSGGIEIINHPMVHTVAVSDSMERHLISLLDIAADDTMNVVIDTKPIVFGKYVPILHRRAVF